MKRLIMAGLLAVAGALSIPTAQAALPAEAYEGPFLDRLWKPATCVPAYKVLPAFTGRSDGPAGTYVWWNARTRKCETAGAAAGPLF